MAGICWLLVVAGVVLAESALGRVIQSSDTSETGHLYFMDSATGNSHRLKRRQVESTHQGGRRFQLKLNSSPKVFDMDLSPSSVWVRDSNTWVRSGEQSAPVSVNIRPECFLSGPLASGDGYASFSFCNGVNGIIQTQNGTYIIGDLDLDQSQTIIPSDLDADLLPSLRVATADSDDVPEDDTICPEDLISAQTLEDHDYIDLEGDLHTTHTTTTTSPKALAKATVEVGIYVNANASKIFKEWGIGSSSKVVEWVVNRWNIIRGVFSDREKVGAEVDVRVKHVEIWWENPAYYAEKEADQDIKGHLGTFCRNTPDDKMDVRILYTWEKKFHIVGLAYVGGVCQSKTKCGIVIPQQSNLQRDLHEFGHSIGLLHDPKMDNCTMPNGFMGWHETTEFKDCYRPVLLKTLARRSSQCLFTDSGVPAQVSEYKENKLTAAGKLLSDILNTP